MNDQQNDKRAEIVATSMAIGTGGGVALGLVLMPAFGNGFFAVGIAIGTTIGVTIGLLLARQQ